MRVKGALAVLILCANSLGFQASIGAAILHLAEMFFSDDCDTCFLL
jgi:hypothetical protein